MTYDIDEATAHAAKHPHEIFLINLIFNHILLFVAFISASSLQHWVILVPVISFAILGYTLWRARRSLRVDPWFVKCHWQIAARRSMIFILMLGIMAAAIVVILLVSGGDPKPQHYAIGGAAVLPTMVTVLALIIMESESLHQAKSGILPRWVEERFPEGTLEPVGE